MNSDVPSPEHELSQDASSEADTNENHGTSTIRNQNECPDSVETSDETETDPQLDGHSLDAVTEQSSTSSDPAIKVSDTESRLQQLEKEHETLNSQYMRTVSYTHLTLPTNREV